MTDSFSTRIAYGASVVTVFVIGDVDAATAPKLAEALTEALAHPATSVEVNCTWMPFIDSSGIRVLLEAHRALGPLGRSFVVSQVQRGPRRILEVCGLGVLLRKDPSGPTQPGELS